MTELETKTDALRPVRIRARLVAVALAVVAALAVWAVASLLGVQLAVTSPLVGTIDINALLVILTALPAALAAWGLLALLERFTPRARRIWTVVAVIVLVVSVPPLAFLDATVSAKVALGITHVVVGVILILVLRRSAQIQ